MEKVFITDKQGNKVLPKTHVSAVYDDEGNDLGSHLGAFEDEVRGLVDTPHQEYVTVATYSALPASGSEDTIYRVSNYDGSQSQVAADVYSEYAWDGTQYVFLCAKSAVGEVFDISAYHNNAKYADLNAALTSNTGGVPQSLQKGGMSVKYVQSSDNKYVQCRLIADEFTTDVTQWQGVDDEPTAGSDNLVKSGGVVSFMKYINTTKESQWVRENLSASGVPSSSTTRCAKSFSCVLGDKIMVNINSGYKAGLFFYDKILDVDKVNASSFLSYISFKTTSFFSSIPKECQTVVIIVGKSDNADITENEAALFGSVNILSTKDTADRNYFRIYDDIQISGYNVTLTDSGRVYAGLKGLSSTGSVRYGIKGGTYTLANTDDVLVLNLSENDPSSTYDGKARLVPTIRSEHSLLPTDFPIVCRLGKNMFRHQPVLDSFVTNSVSSAINTLKEQVTSSNITDISKLAFINGSMTSSFIFDGSTTNRIITCLNGINIKTVAIKANSGYKVGMHVVKGIYRLEEFLNNERINYTWTDNINADIPSSYNTIVILVKKDGNEDILPSEVTSAISEIEIITDRVYIDKEHINIGNYSGTISDFRGNISSSYFCHLDNVPDNKRQGGAVYGENLFLFHTSTNSCLIYNINTGLQIGEVVLPVTSHCNTMVFAPTLHDGNTEYPYLYVSEVIGSAASTEEPSWWRIFVFDIKTVSGTLTATLVQTINTQTLSTSYRGLGPVDFAIDTDNNYMWLICCKTESIYTGQTVFTKIAVPSISNATVNVQDTDVLDTFEVNDIPIRQDCKYYNGKVYVLWGFHGSGFSNGLAVVDLINKRISAQCDLKTIADDEPEALIIYNGDLLYACKDSYLRKLNFGYDVSYSERQFTSLINNGEFIWENGSILNGKDADNNSRKRSIGYIPINNLLYLTSRGNNYAVFYDSDYTWLNTNIDDWTNLTKDSILLASPTARYMRIVKKSTDASDIRIYMNILKTNSLGIAQKNIIANIPTNGSYEDIAINLSNIQNVAVLTTRFDINKTDRISVVDGMFSHILSENDLMLKVKVNSGYRVAVNIFDNIVEESYYSGTTKVFNNMHILSSGWLDGGVEHTIDLTGIDTGKCAIGFTFRGGSTISVSDYSSVGFIAKTYRYSSISGVNARIKNPITYLGKEVSFLQETHVYNYEKVFGTSGVEPLGMTQSFDCFGDYIFTAQEHDITIFNKQWVQLQQITFRPTIASHSNALAFTDVYYDNDDEFPLLLSSICNNTSQEYGFYVLRVTKTNDVFAITVLNRITSDKPCYSWCCSNKILYGAAYTNSDQSYLDVNSRPVYLGWTMPDLLSANLELHREDAIVDFTLPYYGILQDIKFYNGKLYQAMFMYGSYVDAKVPRGIWVINPNNEDVETIIPFHAGYEFEGVMIMENKLYICDRDYNTPQIFNVYKFNF